MSSEPKLKVGDVVVFDNGPYHITNAIVLSVHTEAYGIPFTEPIYTIEWPPTGGATVHERQLSKAEQ